MKEPTPPAPLVSVVMPTHGRPVYVARAIDTVLKQTFTDFELLILDNSEGAEKNRIAELSKSDPRIVYVDRGEVGVTEARRLGASIARGKLFALLDSDDYWDHDRLRKHLIIWKQHRIGLSWDRWAEVSQGLIEEFSQPFPEGIILAPKLAARLYWFNFIHASAGIVSTQFARTLGFPLPEIMSSDWTLFMRAAEYYPAYFIGERLSYKEIESPERVSDVITSEFFAKEKRIVRRWALNHRPGLYGLENAKKRMHNLSLRVKGRPRSTHEPPVMRALLRIKGDIFVDVGANRGQFSIPLSRNFVRVIAVEPNPSLRISGRNIEVIRYAISDRSGEADLYLDEHPVNPNWTLDTILNNFTYRPGHDPRILQQIQGKKSIKVVTQTLDNLLAKIDRVDLLKIDVEGAEFMVLEGAKASLSSRKIQRIVIELHDIGLKEELETVLSEYGYEFGWLDRDHIMGSLKDPSS